MWLFRCLLLCVSLIGWAPTVLAMDLYQQNRIVAIDSEGLHVIDMDTRTDVLLGVRFGESVAANAEKVFIMHDSFRDLPTTFTDILDMRLHWRLGREFLGRLTVPFDMDATTDGTLYVGHQFGVLGYTPDTGVTFPVKTRQIEDIHRSVEIDSSGAVITDFSEYPRPDDPDRGEPGNELVTFLQRQRPGVEEPETIELDILVSDYALSSDTEMFGINNQTIYRIDLETATTEPVWEFDTINGLRSIPKVEVDSLGRVVVMDTSVNQLIRIDLGAGTEEVMQLDFSIVDFDVIPAITPALVAGDADLDLDFDQFDLVRVQVAARYLTGLPATWGQGDWNGAPGGSAAAPPRGDSVFNQRDIVEALSGGAYLTGPYAAVAAGGVAGDTQASLIYDPRTGELAVDAPAGMELTSINIDSAAGVFTGDAALQLGGSFDNDRDTNIFKATFGSSFGSLSFGNVAQTGMSEEFVLNDLTVVGSLAGGGDLGTVDLIYVPEPSSLTHALLSLSTLVWWRRRKRISKHYRL